MFQRKKGLQLSSKQGVTNGARAVYVSHVILLCGPERTVLWAGSGGPQALSLTKVIQNILQKQNTAMQGVMGLRRIVICVKEKVR